VRSLALQIRQAGGRFLEKCDTLGGRNDVWIEVSDKVVRDKISHALRDKHPRYNLEYAKAIMLSVHLRTPGKCIDQDDYVVAAANELLLRAQLPKGECSSDINVEYILTEELESLALLSARDVSIAEDNTSCPSLMHSALRQASPGGLAEHLTKPQPQVDVFPPDVTMSQPQVQGTGGGSVRSNCYEDCFAQFLPKLENNYDNRVPPEEDASTAWKQNMGSTMDQVHKSSLLEREIAFFNLFDIDDDKILHPQELDAYWTKSVGDLPSTFTAEDCEDLLATLDFASSLI